MDPFLINLVWLVGGALLAFSEWWVPGLVVIFLGCAAMMVGGIRLLGLVDSMAWSLVLWMVFSVVLMLTLRRILKRHFPSESSYLPHRPDLSAQGQLVDVLEDVPAEGTPGRIRFEGTTWNALSQGEPIKAGSKARLVVRDNLVWMVEPVPAEELDAVPQAGKT